MGGSGGSSYGHIDPEKFADRLRKSEEQSTSSEFTTEVNKIINDLLIDIDNRPVESIKTHLDIIKNAISSEVETIIDIIFGGSVSKHTYVDGLSDIDSLAIINKTELVGKGPHDVLEYFYQRLRQRLPNTDISKGNLAVTIKYSDNIQIQILPAVRTQTGIKIASSDGQNRWSDVIKPEKFAQKLSEINTKNSQKLIPVIKLAKSIISSLPEKRQITGYHAESLAIEIFKNYTGTKQPKDMLKHFFGEASKSVLHSIQDTTGQSLHVDDYLGTNNSINRQIVSDSFAQIYRKMQNADGSQQIELWKNILS